MYQSQSWTPKLLTEIHINKSKVSYQFLVLVDVPPRESTTAALSSEQAHWETKKERKEISLSDRQQVISKVSKIGGRSTISPLRTKQAKEAKLDSQSDSSYLLNQKLISREYYDF